MADDKGVGDGGDKKDAASVETAPSTTTAAAVEKKRKGFFTRMFSGIFRHGDDFEKRLHYISKEEATVVARLKRRSLTWRRNARNLIVISVLLEVIAIGYAIVTTRAGDLDWKMRTFRILPMFLLPAISSLLYSAFASYHRMRDRKDTKTLERLRAERQAKIDELKERTNYYTTQQLIQRYDPDPAAKAAAATVLATKLGTDSGLKFYVGDESENNASTGKSRDAELVHSGELRNRKHTRSNSTGSFPSNIPEEETPRSARSDGHQTSEYNQLVVNHQSPQGSSPQDGGWIARIAALLVGEDPMQSYALICGNCHMHNGLVKKEDFPYITYYCPHCHALNQPKHLEGHVSGSHTPIIPSLGSLREEEISSVVTKHASDSLGDSVITSTSSVKAGPEIEAVTERTPLVDTGSLEKHE